MAESAVYFVTDPVTLNMFLSAGIFSEATTQRNSEKYPYLHFQEYSKDYMTKFVHSKRVVSSVYSKSLKFYGKKLQ